MANEEFDNTCVCVDVLRDGGEVNCVISLQAVVLLCDCEMV